MLWIKKTYIYYLAIPWVRSKEGQLSWVFCSGSHNQGVGWECCHLRLGVLFKFMRWLAEFHCGTHVTFFSYLKEGPRAIFKALPDKVMPTQDHLLVDELKINVLETLNTFGKTPYDTR